MSIPILTTKLINKLFLRTNSRQNFVSAISPVDVDLSRLTLTFHCFQQSSLDYRHTRTLGYAARAHPLLLAGTLTNKKRLLFFSTVIYFSSTKHIALALLVVFSVLSLFVYKL